MRLFWTPEAADDLEKISDFLYERSPTAALDVVRRIYNTPTILKKFPNLGRPGRKTGTRELVVTSLPYIIIYEVARNAVRILRILHGAQRWP
jgi:toxin ParE1/3/4